MYPFWRHPDEWPHNGRYNAPRLPDPPSPEYVEWVADEAVDADEFLLHRVVAGLTRDSLVQGRQVRVLVQNMVVVLEGSVDSAGARSAAAQRAWSTPGVFDVCNLLAVEPGDGG
jgi:hypothetical protein